MSFGDDQDLLLLEQRSADISRRDVVEPAYGKIEATAVELRSQIGPADREDLQVHSWRLLLHGGDEGGKQSDGHVIAGGDSERVACARRVEDRRREAASYGLERLRNRAGDLERSRRRAHTPTSRTNSSSPSA